MTTPKEQYYASTDGVTYNIGPYDTLEQAYERAFEVLNHDGDDLTVWVSSEAQEDCTTTNSEEVRMDGLTGFVYVDGVAVL